VNGTEEPVWTGWQNPGRFKQGKGKIMTNTQLIILIVVLLLLFGGGGGGYFLSRRGR